ncbi:tRNA-uridine aminocarboxypropyltransferase [Massilia sp. TS11]|uniref:tRNA-uridine aminocarboxypropyltransferase n=1 Tax=Massilia sp. TS11 TaxID=2908003 RepID=UPI001EDC6795|nr:tRNA-uridine aminocarboxypropyltransferase [Massilia sp. TS11]MCG2583178.1 DTW domain-containing protein [Massilia sp. TS11]
MSQSWGKLSSAIIAAVNPSRPLCPRCQRPLPACVCDCAPAVANDVDVLILQHPLETGAAKGSARLLQLSLARCTTLVGEQFDPALLEQHLYADGRQPLLLYPGAPDARAQHAPAALRLVLLDATWRKSRKLLHLNPPLAALPRMALASVPPSRYAIRKAHAPHQLSTLEAACLALADLEAAPARYLPLLDGFERFVARVLARMRP